MPSTNKVRDLLSVDQKRLISAIWKYFLQEDDWIPVRAVHKEFGGKARASALIRQLGGSIVLIPDQYDLERYKLTVLGILLSDRGQHYERLLANYLKFAYQKCYEEPSRTAIKSQEVAEAQLLEPAEVSVLGYLIFEGRNFCDGGSLGKDQWEARLPTNIEELPPDSLAYVQEAVGADYNPEMPIEARQQLAYLLARRGKNPIVSSSSPDAFHEETKGVPPHILELDFSFIASADMKMLIESDYEEVWRCMSVGAHKSVIVLCGSIVEAILLEQLLRQEHAAKSAASALGLKGAKTLDQWNLHDLVAVATQMGIISSEHKNLANQIRGYRNIIHPGVQDRLDFNPNQLKALTAITLLGNIVEYLR